MDTVIENIKLRDVAHRSIDSTAGRPGGSVGNLETF